MVIVIKESDNNNVIVFDDGASCDVRNNGDNNGYDYNDREDSD